MDRELEEALDRLFSLKRKLSQVLAPDLVEYILELIARDNAHRRLEELVKGDENDIS